MKKILLCLIPLLFSALTAKSQVETQPLSQEVFDESVYNPLLNFPDLVLPAKMKSRSIPYKVDHSETPYYRTPFPQDGLSCGQASSVGMCFTYEIDRKRDLPANINANLYPTHFAFNWVNGDYGTEGASYYHSIELLKQVGTPNQEEYGGTPHSGGLKRWMSGYSLYYSAMHNRLNKVYKINVANAEGMETLKNWIYDHIGGEVPGGCAVTYAGNRYPDAVLPAGTEDAGMYVLTTGATTSSHSFTFLGYNDSVRYDYNGDGIYTNDIDINGDGVVDMHDWEIGALIMSETYFGATAWGNNGFCYLMYKAIADGYLWSDIVHVMDVNHTYTPLLTAKVNMTYTHRKQIKIYAGISNDPAATYPEHIIDFPIFNYQGGYSYMKGGTEESDKTIEFGLDLTPLINYITSNNVKLFLQVYENDPNGIADGTVNSFSVIDYSGDNPIETICTEQNVNIINYGVTTLSIGTTTSFSSPTIATPHLEPGAVMSDYEKQLAVSGGTAPYEWSFDTDYRVEQSTSAFPTGGSVLQNNSPINLNFTFNYYGEEINTIYGHTQGLMIFQPNFGILVPYANAGFESHLFYNSKCISPYLTRTNIANQMHYINGSDFATIIWTHNDIKHAATIHADGRIVLQYQLLSQISPHITYSCGVSKGDNENFTKIIFDNGYNIQTGLTYTLSCSPAPEDFQISEEGLLTGVPTREYIQEPFHFKVKDNNGLVDRKSLPFFTDGVLLDFIVHTTNGDDIIEYNETVTLDMIVENPKLVPTGQMIAVATCNDPYITMINSSCPVPAIDSMQSVTLTNVFSFSVASDIPDGHQFRINFEFTSSGTNWNYFNLFSGFAPQFVTEEITIGNSSQFLTYNDQATVTVPVRNFGGAVGKNLTFVATTSDPNVLITNGSQQNIQLASGNIYPFAINVQTANAIPESYEVPVSIAITGDQGFEEETSFLLPIYTVDLEVENISYDDQLIPGVERSITFGIRNCGKIVAQQVNIALSLSNLHVTVVNPTQTIANLAVDGLQNILFTVVFDRYCEYGEQIEGEITISGEWGVNYSIPVSFIVGEIIVDFENGSLDEPLLFEAGGDLPWFITQDEVFEGEYSMRSGEITHNQHSEMEMEIFVLVPGRLSFNYKVSSETNYDHLIFSIDDEEVLKTSGDKIWQRAYFDLTEGFHRLKWSYSKDHSVNRFSDAVWVDEIIFPPLGDDNPQFTLPTNNIVKNIYQDQIEDDIFVIRNNGEQIVDYQMFIKNDDSKNIGNSFLSTTIDIFTPGTTVDIPFTLHASTPDLEWIKRVEIQFPEGITVNSASNIVGMNGTLTWLNITGDGVNTVWTINEANGAIRDNENVDFTVNVTIDENWRNPISELSYLLTGDIYGAEPHTVSSTIEMTNSLTFWLTSDHWKGRIIGTAEKDMTLTFNSHGLELGTYYAELVFITPERKYYLPVQLNVIEEDTSDIVNSHENISMNCYPNPFTDKIFIELNTLKRTLIEDIRLLDAQGKSVATLDLRKAINSGKSQFSLSPPRHLPAGVYFIQLKFGGETVIQKLVKME
ncbi:T9SS type A sorting domain-containing protein [Bacteroidales bacterium OttesenSCG-928-L19]|nr:T9SS type A sorting domain-containing protein [Bacteroidales bacterium OttesenSCG-928-L19]